MISHKISLPYVFLKIILKFDATVFATLKELCCICLFTSKNPTSADWIVGTLELFRKWVDSVHFYIFELPWTAIRFLTVPLMGQDAPLCEERWTFSECYVFAQNGWYNIKPYASPYLCLQSFSIECGICYSYRLEDSIPDQVCNDPRCGQPFHHVCLYEVCSWMTEFRIWNKTIKFLLVFWRWTEKRVNFYFTLLIFNEGNIPILQ